MNKNYYTAHAADLGSMRPALGQIAGYRRALSDLGRDISRELKERAAWEL